MRARAETSADQPREFPVIDISTFTTALPNEKKDLAARVDQVCRETGFLAVVGHEIPDSVAGRVLNAARDFFDLPLDKKLEVKIPYKGYPYGYAPMETEILARSIGNETPPDLKESFSVGPLKRPYSPTADAETSFRFAPNLWPGEPAEFREAWSDYYRAMEGLAAKIMRVFAVALNLPSQFFDDKIEQHTSAMRALNYPRMSTPARPGQFRAGAHTDYGSLTILRTDSNSTGLQIRTPEGLWQPVPTAPGALIVNIGDLMARWTNDRWVSTLHRVVVPDRDQSGFNRRLSIAFFHQPNWDAEISCIPSCLSAGEKPRYAPVTSGAHLMEKFLRTQ